MQSGKTLGTHVNEFEVVFEPQARVDQVRVKQGDREWLFQLTAAAELMDAAKPEVSDD